MNQMFLKRYVAALLLLTLLFPIGLGLAHAVDSHRDSACHPETESHIHRGRADCGFLHVIAPNVHWVASEDLESTLPFWPEFRAKKATTPDQSNWVLDSNIRRGPPEFVFLL